MPNKIYSYTFRDSMPEDEILTEDVILIDTHNFTTTAIEALDNGAKSIIPLNSLKGGLPNKIDILAGDEDSTLRNHPEDMKKSTVKNKNVGINSWNGTKAAHSIRSLNGGDNIYLASLTNAGIVSLEFKNNNEITFVLSGSNGNVPPEDVITMQLIINLFNCKNKNELNKVCDVYKELYKSYVLKTYNTLMDYCDKQPFGNQKNHAHNFASQINSKSIIPVMGTENKFQIK